MLLDLAKFIYGKPKFGHDLLKWASPSRTSINVQCNSHFFRCLVPLTGWGLDHFGSHRSSYYNMNTIY